MLRTRLSGQKGFTLIELLVVVAILGILAGIAAPRVMDAIDNARVRKAQADMVVIKDALERFYLDYAIFPPSLYWLTQMKYLDPNTTFANAFGKRYFYMVKQGDTAATNLKDYRLGDPGQIPPAVGALPKDAAGMNALSGLPEGIAIANNTGWGWHAAAVTPLALGTYTSVTDPTKSITLSGVTVTQFTSVDPPVGTNIVWSYQGQ